MDTPTAQGKRTAAPYSGTKDTKSGTVEAVSSGKADGSGPDVEQSGVGIGREEPEPPKMNHSAP